MLELLVLVIVANSAPVLARHLCGARFAVPVDGGRMHRDGRPLLGSSKTWRGLAAGLLATPLVALLLGIEAVLGLATGALALGGDLAASFAKRRRGYVASARAPLLDTLPEALLPAAVLREAYAIDWLEVGVVTAAFHVIVRASSPLLFRLGLRRRPW
ncbi:MAG: CDP-archaeol synthase [Gammaproteobacteria bacterium]